MHFPDCGVVDQEFDQLMFMRNIDQQVGSNGFFLTTAAEICDTYSPATHNGAHFDAYAYADDDTSDHDASLTDSACATYVHDTTH